MNPFLESPLFKQTAVYIGFLIAASTLIIQILLSITPNNEDKDYTMKLMSKITHCLQYFEEFSLAIFTVMAGAYFYLEKKNIGRIVFNQYSSGIQIVIIIISIFVMNLLSNIFKHNISIHERASLRLLGSIYSVINLIIIREISDDKSLDTTLICYIGLILGRFIFFDSSTSLIFSEFRKIGANAYTGVTCFCNCFYK